MMNFDEFLEAARDRIKELVIEADVKVQAVDKLQGESYVGIAVRPEHASAAVTFNLNAAYDRYQADESQKDAILNKIAADAKQVSSAIPAFEVSSITDYETVKDHLTMQVVPVEPNKEMLEGIPHKTIEDIAVVYRVEIPGSADGTATTLVTNQLLSEYGITPGQLHRDALEAQVANHPPVLKNMSEIMAEMSGGMMDMPESPMWVATVEGGMNGASVTQIPGFLEESAEKLGGDFFVLPSSIHEVLFIRDDGSFEREHIVVYIDGDFCYLMLRFCRLGLIFSHLCNLKGIIGDGGLIPMKVVRVQCAIFAADDYRLVFQRLPFVFHVGHRDYGTLLVATSHEGILLLALELDLPMAATLVAHQLTAEVGQLVL